MSIAVPLNGLKEGDGGGRALNDLRIRMRVPAHFSFSETSDVLGEVEDFLDERRAVYGVRTMIARYRTGSGDIQVFLESDSNEPWWHAAYRNGRKKLGFPVDTRMDRVEVIQDLKVNVPRFVGVETVVERGDDTADDPSLSVNLRGPDTDVLTRLAEEVARRLRTVPSIVSVDSDLESSGEEIRVHVNRDRASRLGVSTDGVGRSVAFALQGVSLTRFQTEGQDVEVRLGLRDNDRQTVQQLRNYTFRSQSGKEVALSDIADLEVATTNSTIRRENGRSRVRVKAFTTKDDLKGLYAEIDRAMLGFVFPRGYEWDKGERYAKFKEENETMTFAGIWRSPACFC